MNPDMDAVYVLTPQPHIVDCLMSDLEKRKYRRFFLIWTSGKVGSIGGQHFMLKSEHRAQS